MGATPFLKQSEIERCWFIVDADGRTLGRMATIIARKLLGKDKATYTPHMDDGDFVIVVNAEKVAVTGRKERDKLYRHHTGYLGALREATLSEVRAKHPDRIITDAVWGMLPKNRLGRKIITKLKVYAGAEHPHQAQKPKPLDV